MLFSQRWLERMNGMTTKHIEAFWENATANDVAGIASTRKPILARVRDEENEVWREDLISGWRLSRFLPGAVWIDADGVHWKHCQVYREQSWYTNKPDPGPGFRLLEKFPDEDPMPGDECLGVSGAWGPSCQAKDGGHQVFGIWYRRRIEVEPKFAVGQMVRVVGPKATDARYWSEKMNQHIGTTSPIKVREKKDDSWFYELGCSVIWSFSEDYLESVEPEPKHYVLRVGDTFETPSGHLIKVASLGTCQMQYKLKAGFKAILPNGQAITATEKGFEVTQ
jgi:hypothetical protein